MKIAIISDIHGNVPALSAVINDILEWQADKLIVNGDIVNRGPYSLSVFNMLQSLPIETILLKGNHEEFVIFAHENPVKVDQFNYHLRCFAQWTAEQLGESILKEIHAWPSHHEISIDGKKKQIHITHGSPLSSRDGIHANLSEAQLREKNIHVHEAFISSHTHLPMLRYLDNTLVLNTGSVGQPLDGNEKASYGKITVSNTEIRGEIARVAYDKEQADKDYFESGFLDHGGPVAQLIYLEHKYNRRVVGPFMRAYLTDINEKKVTVETAVNQYLTDEKLFTN